MNQGSISIYLEKFEVCVGGEYALGQVAQVLLQDTGHRVDITLLPEQNKHKLFCRLKRKDNPYINKGIIR